MQNYPEDSDVEIAARLLRGEKQEQAVRQMDHPAQKVIYGIGKPKKEDIKSRYLSVLGFFYYPRWQENTND